MFLGEFTHNVDDKGRMTIPSRLRAGFANGAVITRGFEPCLVVYPIETFRLLEAKAQNLSTTDPSNRALNRLLFGGAADVALDSVGRVLIPPYLRTYAQLGDEIVIVGAGQYLEVWDAAKWAEQAAAINNAEANSQRFASLDLAIGGQRG
jgi:transcriptional regulator MraZ